jgi:hypothetical protein
MGETPGAPALRLGLECGWPECRSQPLATRAEACSLSLSYLVYLHGAWYASDQVVLICLFSIACKFLINLFVSVAVFSSSC